MLNGCLRPSGVHLEFAHEIVSSSPHSRTPSNRSRIIVLVPCKKCQRRGCSPDRESVPFLSNIEQTKHLSSVKGAQSIGGPFAHLTKDVARVWRRLVPN